MIELTSSRAIALVISALLVGACAREPETGRGAGLRDAALAPAAQARAYEAAMRTSFDFGPSLSLLIDPSMLPRGPGAGPGPALPEAVRRELIRSGVFRGTCTPAAEQPANAPICDAKLPGYVVRVSDIYQLAPDSLQLHVLVRRYDTRATAPHREFRFEEIHQLSRQGGEWVVVRRARLRNA